MGVSILMRDGTRARPTSAAVNITPGWRSQAAEVLRSTWGEFPVELRSDHDSGTLETMARAASVYSPEDENIWRKIARALDSASVVTIDVEY